MSESDKSKKSEMREKIEIKLGGFGGQGVILAGIIIGKAASIYDGRQATLTQSFGPESRGSACSAALIISGKRVLYPYVAAPDIMVLMSQEAFEKYGGELAKGGTYVREEDLVKAESIRPDAKVFRIPATRVAEELGRRMVMNIVMVGFFTAVTGAISESAARRAIEESVPGGTEELNLRAFERGFALGKKRRK